MIIIKIQGGLGNQMFQYALGCAIKKAGYQEEIKYDISDYNRFFAHTGFSLEKYFGISPILATKGEIKKLYPGAVYSKDFMKYPEMLKNFYAKFYHYKSKVSMLIGCSTYLTDYRSNVYNDELLHLKSGRDYYIKGYFQNYNYFKTILKDLPKIFTFQRELQDEDLRLLEKINESDSLAIHIRRGDYTGTGFDLLTPEYFKMAIERIPDWRNKKIFVFSDDHGYIQDNFAFLGEYTLVKHTADQCDIDMRLMSCCKHMLLSNSTFGLWAAYLGIDKETVVVPKIWFSSDRSFLEMAVPENWVVVDNCV